jgi:hypothetical protein
MRTSGSIASGNLKLGLGRYGVISAFGRKEVESFSFTPSLFGNFQETIVLENVLDSSNDQNVLVKAAVRKLPSFAVEPTSIDFGNFGNQKWPAAMGFVLTNISKHERTFLVEAGVDSGAFAGVSLTMDDKDAGTALSKGEEEELEALLQKLKIARRKGKTDKIAKYESRLSELGVNTKPQEADAEAETLSAQASGSATPFASPTQVPKICTPSLSVTLQPNQKHKILVELLPKDISTETVTGRPIKAVVKVYDRKNTDETIGITVEGNLRVESEEVETPDLRRVKSASTGT